MASWPAELPQGWPRDFDWEPVDGRETFQPDAGPAIFNKRFTAEPVVVTLSPILMSESQWDLLETFYSTTLSGGVDEFDWTDPYPDAGLVRVRFQKRPTYRSTRHRGNVPASMIVTGSSEPQRLMRVSMVLEILPWFPPSG